MAEPTALYSFERHTPIPDDVRWLEGAARATIDAIIRDTCAAFDPATLFTRHPRDEDFDTDVPQKTLYLGAAGVAVALDQLQRRGYEVEGPDLVALVDRLPGLWQREPDLADVGACPSYYLGRVGLEVARLRLAPERADLDGLREAIEGNITHPSLEALWGAPGTMLGALAAFDVTRDELWRDLYIKNVDHLEATWHAFEERGVRIWTQDLYGSHRRLTGAGHGAAGNLYAIMAGAHLLPRPRAEAIFAGAVELMTALAVRGAEGVNWYPVVTETAPEDRWVLQWCHGAPGIITAMRPLPIGLDDTLEALLRDAGELVWAAGPLSKGFGLCHGTAGNGYSFLELHRRSGGDRRWLERARAFAAFAITQYEASHIEHGQGRYSLYTGDLGLALYLADVIDGEGAFPLLEWDGTGSAG